jgi:nitrogen fixation/metabolism regulation signal transduction histidine kinase
MKKTYFYIIASLIIIGTIALTALLKNKEINPQTKKQITNKALINGYATYNENKKTIISVYYSLLVFLALILLFNAIFKKNKKENLEEEIEELLKKPKEEVKKQDIKKEIKEQETKTEDGVFKKEEEKLVDEIKEEIVEEKEKPKEIPPKGQPAPIEKEKNKVTEENLEIIQQKIPKNN